MKTGLVPGVSAERRFQVAPEMCPHFDGVLVHPVCATWEVVHQMEVTGRDVLLPFLEPHEEGVGVHIHVDHKTPAPIGTRVTVRAAVVSYSHRRLTCDVSASTNQHIIALGRFVQVIMPKAHLQRLFARHRP